MLEIEFPRTIAFKAAGGPSFSTVVNQGLSGSEARNQNWIFSRGKWKVPLVTPTSFADNRQAFADALRTFFQLVAGKATAFRLWDPLDHQATDSPLAVIPGTSNLQWQLQKQVVIGGNSYVEPVYKIVWHTITDYRGNALTDQLTITNIAGDNTWTVDPTTGIVSFSEAPFAPAATFQFHYPVRFDTDELAMAAEPSWVSGGQAIVSMDSLTLIEVKAPNF